MLSDNAETTLEQLQFVCDSKLSTIYCVFTEDLMNEIPESNQILVPTMMFSLVWFDVQEDRILQVRIFLSLLIYSQHILE